MTTESSPLPWIEKHSNILIWLAGTIVAIFVSWANLRVEDTTLAQEIASVKTAQAARDTAYKEQLDRIENRLLSIDEYLRDKRMKADK